MPTLSQEEFKNLAKQQLLDAISYYIEGQKIVAQALSDLGFNINIFGDPNDKQAREEIEKWLAHVSEISQKGIWVDSDNNEWEYYVHGGGCRLTNVSTREPIEWDVPNLDTFDPFFFHDNLFWQFRAENRYDKVGAVLFWVNHAVDELIRELVGDGKLSKDYSLLDRGKQNDRT
ncbi:MAG: hypothetical protein HYZ25_07275 [Chloroflexi bacterium]|nr:hypothetical protein [Chloroflexota bacterium]